MILDASTPFTPVAAALGGLLIGLSAVLVMGLFGRIAGISGITAGALRLRRPDWPWRLAFLLGLIAAPLAFQWASGRAVAQTVPSDPTAMAIAGLLVGFGTVLGSGCTSGHGVCGLARLSRRSLVAVAVFMATGALTVFALRHLL